MKAHLRFIFVLIFPFLLFSIACTKETKPKEEIMPPYTETGAHTFACKVNGKVWISQGSRFDYMVVWYSPEQKMLGISAENEKGRDEAISFSPISNVTGPGEYIIGEETGNTASYHIVSPLPERRYATKEGYGGKLIVKKLDTINHICSGTFYFDAVSTGLTYIDTTYKKGEVVHITEGQFDFKYKR